MMSKHTFTLDKDVSRIDRSRRAFVRLAGATTLLPLMGLAAAQPDEVGTVRSVVDFDPAAGELPESIAFDTEGNAYVTLGTGEIRSFTPNDLEDGTEGEPFATVSPFAPEEDLFAGITATPGGTLYAVQISPVLDLEALDIPDSSGTVWEIGSDGAAEPLVDLPLEETGDAFPNDLIHRERHGDLLITDSLQGTIWQVTNDGEATVWLSDPLLEPDQEAPFFPIGANGIAQTNGCLYVANSTTASLVRVPVAADGTAGTPSLLVQDERLFGADGIALDVYGNVYIAVSAGESIARVTPGGSVNILAESSGLAFPSAVAFGTAPRQERTIYITNYDAVEALMDGTPEPSLAALDVDVAGRSI